MVFFGTIVCIWGQLGTLVCRCLMTYLMGTMSSTGVSADTLVSVGLVDWSEFSNAHNYPEFLQSVPISTSVKKLKFQPLSHKPLGDSTFQLPSFCEVRGGINIHSMPTVWQELYCT